MSDVVSGYSLYRHRQDDSIRMLARPLPDETYECKRYGEQETFELDKEAFLASYQKASR